MSKLQQLKRDAEREALHRLENAARTLQEFDVVLKEWDRIDRNRERRERYYEVGLPDWAMHQLYGWDEEFLDIIYDNAAEMWQLVEDADIAEMIRDLTLKRRDVFYLGAMRLYTPKQIAFLKGQTDHNIRKMQRQMLAKLRKKLLQCLKERERAGWPLTLRERGFMREFENDRSGG